MGVTYSASYPHFPIGDMGVTYSGSIGDMGVTYSGSIGDMGVTLTRSLYIKTDMAPPLRGAAPAGSIPCLRHIPPGIPRYRGPQRGPKYPLEPL